MGLNELKILSAADRRSSLRRFIQGVPLEGGVYVFAYGSLLWNPELEIAASGLARVQDYRRALCVKSIVHRGTPECPGLVLGLIRSAGMHCIGKVYHLAPRNIMEQLHSLWERELPTDAYTPAWVNALVLNDLHDSQSSDLAAPLAVPSAAGRVCRAITFISETAEAQFYAKQSAQDLLGMVSCARGERGECAEYVKNTWQCLSENRIIEPQLQELAALLNTAPQQ